MEDTTNSEWTDFSAGDVPDEMQHQLSALADLGEQKAWGVARLIEVLDRGLQAEGKIVPRKVLYAAVGQHARSAGETCRSYHRIYLAVPEAIRVEFGEMLGFHSFKALVPHCHNDEEWASTIGRWLDYAAGSGHSPQSVDGLRAWVQDQQGAPPPEVGRHQRIGKAVRLMLEDPKVPDPMQKVYRKLFDTVNNQASIHALSDWIWTGLMPVDGEEV